MAMNRGHTTKEQQPAKPSLEVREEGLEPLNSNSHLTPATDEREEGGDTQNRLTTAAQPLTPSSSVQGESENGLTSSVPAPHNHSAGKEREVRATDLSGERAGKEGHLSMSSQPSQTLSGEMRHSNSSPGYHNNLPRDQFTARGGSEGKVGGGTRGERREQPKLAAKSQAVLELAEKILRLKQSRKQRGEEGEGGVVEGEEGGGGGQMREERGGESESEIYDDILNLMSTDDDIYDDTVILPNSGSAGPDSTSLTSHMENEDDVYDDLVPQTPMSSYSGTKTSKPPVPRKSAQLYKHPKVLELLQRIQERHSQGMDCEELYDDVISLLTTDYSEQGRSLPHNALSSSSSVSAEMLKNKVTSDHSNLEGGRRGRGLAPMDEGETRGEGGGEGGEEEGEVEMEGGREGGEGSYHNIGSGVMATNESQTAGNPLIVGSELADSSPLCQGSSHSMKDTLYDNFPPNTGQNDQDGGSQEIYSEPPEEGLYENECLISGKKVQYKSDERSYQLYKQFSQEGGGNAQQFILVNPAKLPQGGSNTLPTRRTRSKESSSRPFSLSVNFPSTSSDQEQDGSASDSSDIYEDLPLYEHLDEYAESPYQNLTDTVLEALDLPTMVRARTVRMEARRRRKLKKVAQRKLEKLRRVKSLGNQPVKEEAREEEHLAEKVEEEEEKEVGEKEEEEEEGREDGKRHTARGKERMEGEEGEEGEGKKEEKEGEGSESEEEEEIPFGKSRVVFEMLLDASGIQRIGEGSSASHTPHDSPATKPREIKPTDTSSSEAEGEEEEEGKEEKGEDEKAKQGGKSMPSRSSTTRRHKQPEQSQSPQNYFLTSQEFDKLKTLDPDMQRYEQAGIVQLRSKDELRREIEEIIANAPPEPPPLPGITRPRARVMTWTDTLLHHRLKLKRQKTIATATLPRSASPGSTHFSTRYQRNKRFSMPVATSNEERILESLTSLAMVGTAPKVSGRKDEKRDGLKEEEGRGEGGGGVRGSGEGEGEGEGERHLMEGERNLRLLSTVKEEGDGDVTRQCSATYDTPEAVLEDESDFDSGEEEGRIYMNTAPGVVAREQNTAPGKTLDSRGSVATLDVPLKVRGHQDGMKNGSKEEEGRVEGGRRGRGGRGSGKGKEGRQSMEGGRDLSSKTTMKEGGEGEHVLLGDGAVTWQRSATYDTPEGVLADESDFESGEEEERIYMNTAPGVVAREQNTSIADHTHNSADTANECNW